MANQIKVMKADAYQASFIIDAQIAMARETENLELDYATLSRGVMAVFNDPTHGEYYVAIEVLPQGKERLIACLLTMPEWSDWRNGKVLWIHSAYVIPEARKSGVFSKMYEHLKALVQVSPEYRGLRLYVDKRNTSAQNVYHKLGMSNEHYEMFEWMK